MRVRRREEARDDDMRRRWRRRGRNIYRLHQLAVIATSLVAMLSSVRNVAIRSNMTRSPRISYLPVAHTDMMNLNRQ